MTVMKHSWRPGSHWWVPCTQEADRLLADVDRVLERARASGADPVTVKLWQDFALLLYDCFNNGNDRWHGQQSVTVGDFRSAAAQLPNEGAADALEALNILFESAEEERQWYDQIKHVESWVLEEGGFNSDTLPGRLTEELLQPVQEALVRYVHPRIMAAAGETPKTAPAGNALKPAAKRNKTKA
jgi:hypothetical protein